MKFLATFIKALAWALIAPAIFLALYLYLHPNIIKHERSTTVTVENNIVHIDGAIPYALAPRLAWKLMGTDHPTLYLASPNQPNTGGNAIGAVLAVKVLRWYGVDTVVTNGACGSSCALLALAFPQRYITRDGRLRFHDIHNGSVVENDPAALIDARDRTRKMIAAGGEYDPNAVDRIFNTPPKGELWEPSTADMLASRFVLGCWNAETDSPAECEAL